VVCTDGGRCSLRNAAKVPCLGGAKKKKRCVDGMKAIIHIEKGQRMVRGGTGQRKFNRMVKSCGRL